MFDKIRKFENIHILLWLLKDFCWINSWKWLALGMILPTIGLAIWITMLSRKRKEDFIHNVAVVFWISGNATWMTGEFTQFEPPLKWIGSGFFAIGLLVLVSFYIQKFIFSNWLKS
jgi:TctA family transporter